MPHPEQAILSILSMPWHLRTHNTSFCINCSKLCETIYIYIYIYHIDSQRGFNHPRTEHYKWWLKNVCSKPSSCWWSWYSTVLLRYAQLAVWDTLSCVLEVQETGTWVIHMTTDKDDARHQTPYWVRVVVGECHVRNRSHIRQSHSTITLQNHTRQSHSTITLQNHTAESHSTITLQNLTRQSHSTITLDNHTRQSHCRISLQNHTAESHSTITLQNHTAESHSGVKHENHRHSQFNW